MSFYKFENLTKDKKTKEKYYSQIIKRDKIVSNLLAGASFVELVWAIEKTNFIPFDKFQFHSREIHLIQLDTIRLVLAEDVDTKRPNSNNFPLLYLRYHKCKYQNHRQMMDHSLSHKTSNSYASISFILHGRLTKDKRSFFCF